MTRRRERRTHRPTTTSPLRAWRLSRATYSHTHCGKSETFQKVHESLRPTDPGCVLRAGGVRCDIMDTFRVELGAQAHPVHVGVGLLDRLGELARASGLKPGRAALLTDSNVARLYGARVH